jgi:class 3 adenylate cyclase
VRVNRCFAFIDLCGFTSYTEQHGDNQAVAVLALLRATLRAEAERSGVRVTKWLGDGAMLSGVDRIAVLECTATVAEVMAERSPLALRGGIAEGAVIMFEGDDYIGAAVNAAARLCAVARPGQILIAASAADEPLPDWLTVTPLEPVSVDGLSRPVDVAEMRIRRRAA